MSKTQKAGLLKQAGTARDEWERADVLSRLAAEVGFDWPDATSALAKVTEEVEELDVALNGALDAAPTGDNTEVEAELGDLLFAVLNVARKAGVDAQAALGRTNDKFERRFARIEAMVAADGRAWDEFTLEELEAVWVAAKNDERPA
jgi:uncharacterized protein YabN with tetrapyrrole methylase and pyrophosphatase domain